MKIDTPQKGGRALRFLGLGADLPLEIRGLKLEKGIILLTFLIEGPQVLGGATRFQRLGARLVPETRNINLTPPTPYMFILLFANSLLNIHRISVIMLLSTLSLR